jgi:hypothetical protein
MDKGRTAMTAHHEAGHAVVASALGYKPMSATIIPTREDHGWVKYPNPLRGIQLDIDGSDKARLRAERLIKICLAGPLAQRRFKPSSWRRGHGASDFDMAADVAMRVCGSGKQAAAFVKWLEVVTREMVEAQWGPITRVAERLMARKRLSAEEIAVAIRPARAAAPLRVR